MTLETQVVSMILPFSMLINHINRTRHCVVCPTPSTSLVTQTSKNPIGLSFDPSGAKLQECIGSDWLPDYLHVYGCVSSSLEVRKFARKLREVGLGKLGNLNLKGDQISPIFLI